MREGFSCTEKLEPTSETGGISRAEMWPANSDYYQSSSSVFQWLLGPWGFCDAEDNHSYYVLSGRIIPT